jgi:hypothetical protein
MTESQYFEHLQLKFALFESPDFGILNKVVDVRNFIFLLTLFIHPQPAGPCGRLLGCPWLLGSTEVNAYFRPYHQLHRWQNAAFLFCHRCLPCES